MWPFVVATVLTRNFWRGRSRVAGLKRVWPAVKLYHRSSALVCKGSSMLVRTIFPVLGAFVSD
jgi:hypothetical protein